MKKCTKEPIWFYARKINNGTYVHTQGYREKKETYIWYLLIYKKFMMIPRDVSWHILEKKTCITAVYRCD